MRPRPMLLLFVTFLYFHHTNLPAQTSKTKPQTNKKRVYTAPVKSNSRYHIERIGLVATVNYFGSGLGIDYGYTPNDLFQIDYQLVATEAKLSGGTAFEARETLDIRMIRLSALPKIELISQFYLGAGFNVSSLTGTYGFQGAAVQNGALSSNIKALLLHADLFLGSQWQGESYYIAADWLGITYVNKQQNFNIDVNPDLETTTQLLTGESVNQRINREIQQQLRLYYLSIHAGIRF